MVYFDFDNFKPFNDKYGFRVGDRVIQLFANILSSQLQNKDYFIGHVGGDDFREVFIIYHGLGMAVKPQILTLYCKIRGELRKLSYLF